MIAEVWQLAFGQSLLGKPRSGPNQVRVVCPFHDDHSPSCDVSLEKDAFFCRSCDAHGGYLDVVIRAGYAANRREAAAWLKRRGLRLA
jgi:hypothetical protein